MAADFTWALTDEPTHDDLVPLYTAILSGKTKPSVSLGAVTTAQALDWLTTQHMAYRQSIGRRSGLIQNMKIGDRVTLVDVTDAPP